MIGNSSVIFAGFQRQDDGLSSLAALEYEVDGFIKAVGGGGETYEFRTMDEVRTDLGLVIGTDVQTYDAGLTSLAALSYSAASFVKMTGTDTFALRTLQETSDDLEATIDHDNLLNFSAEEHFLQSEITEVGTIATGTWGATDVGIAYGGTGQSTAQAAIDTLTNVEAATNEYVLTKDTASGNAIWKEVASEPEGDVPVTVDSESNTMLKAHAYLTQTAGFVTAWEQGQYWLKGFVGITTDPAGAGQMIGNALEYYSASAIHTISFFVAKGKYFEITSTGASVDITWTPLIAGGGAPIDQD